MCALQGEGEQDLPVMIPGGALTAWGSEEEAETGSGIW